MKWSTRTEQGKITNKKIGRAEVYIYDKVYILSISQLKAISYIWIGGGGGGGGVNSKQPLRLFLGGK